MILVIAHDSGGANVLASWAKHHPMDSYNCIAEGPALKIFEDVGPIYSRQELLTKCMEAQYILVGTSWQSDLEQQGIEMGLSLNKTVYCFLDQTVNLDKRFAKGQLPSEFWVWNERDKKVVEEEFPNSVVLLKTNYYVEDMVQRIKLYTHQICPRTLNLFCPWCEESEHVTH